MIRENVIKRYAAPRPRMHPDDRDAMVDRLINNVLRYKLPDGSVREHLGGFEFHAEFKDVDENERIIEGEANTINMDRYEDIIAPKAFKASARHYVKHGPILAHHAPWWVVGIPLAATIHDKGVTLRAKIHKGLSAIDPIEEVWNVVQQGGIKAFSVGFLIAKNGIKFVEEEGKKIRKIVALDWLETSLVSIPANKQSLFSVTKSLECGTDIDGFEMNSDAFTYDARALMHVPSPREVTVKGDAALSFKEEATYGVAPDDYSPLAEFVKTADGVLVRQQRAADVLALRQGAARLDKLLKT